MKRILSCLIKYPSFIILCVVFGYIFGFKTQLTESGWLNWVWFIFVCVICILNLFFVSGTIFSEDEEDETIFKLLSTLATFILYGSIILKSINCEILDVEIIGISSAAYFLTNGIGQYSCSYIYLLVGSYIGYHYVQLDNWYVIALFIIGLLSIVISIFSICLDKLNADDDCDISIIGIGGILTLAISFILKGNFPEMNDNRIVLFAVYLIVSIYSIFSNKAILFAVMPISVVSYFCYFVYPHSYISIALIILLCFIGISLFNYISMLRTVVNHLYTQNYNLTKEYNDLANNYNELVKTASDLVGKYNTPSSNSGIDFGKLFQKEMYKKLIRDGIEILTSL